jgi:uncharacterized protein involved in exopolysaccharide biosynthesis
LAICAAAGGLVLIISLLLPKQYTATASILIDPPAGDDARVSVAVNPAYVESLRSYETLASSDTLFLRVLDKLHLRDSESATLESLKKRILKVTKLRDTKILQISATLRDPKQAQALAQFLAEETVDTNRTASRENDQDLVTNGQRQADDARVQLERDEAAWREFTAREPLNAVRAEVETLTSLRKTLRQDLVDSRAEAAELAARPGDARLDAARARVASLENQDAELGRQIESKAALVSQREARAQELELRLHTAQVNVDAMAGRLRDLRASAGLRGERLRVMDPGAVPERPSSPNVGLNVALALAVAFIGSITYLTLTFRPADHDRSAH